MAKCSFSFLILLIFAISDAQHYQAQSLQQETVQEQIVPKQDEPREEVAPPPPPPPNDVIEAQVLVSPDAGRDQEGQSAPMASPERGVVDIVIAEAPSHAFINYIIHSDVEDDGIVLGGEQQPHQQQEQEQEPHPEPHPHSDLSDEIDIGYVTHQVGESFDSGSEERFKRATRRRKKRGRKNSKARRSKRYSSYRRARAAARRDD